MNKYFVPIIYLYYTNFLKFFGMIRQVARPNDHPTGPTFLNLYRKLSLYSVLKSPKSRNCSILDVHAPKITIKEIKEIFHAEKNLKI